MPDDEPESEGSPWRATVTSRVLLVSAIVLAVVAAALLVFWLVARPGTDFFVVVVAAAIAVAFCTACARVSVSIDASGVVVESGFLTFTLAQYTLDQIADARVADVSPANWFGWGYRFTLGGSALILQGGSALVLDLLSGKDFTLTLPAPAAAAALAALESAADAAAPPR